MVEGMCRETPDEVAPVSTSGAESTQSEISEDWTLNAAQLSVCAQADEARNLLTHVLPVRHRFFLRRRPSGVGPLYLQR